MVYDEKKGRYVVSEVIDEAAHEERRLKKKRAAKRKMRGRYHRDTSKVIDVTNPHLKKFFRLIKKDVGYKEPINIGPRKDGN